ncbi:hypothetical protein PFISCL1PPCAC_25278, partial [Pristionchus fissidentatus]
IIPTYTMRKGLYWVTVNADSSHSSRARSCLPYCCSTSGCSALSLSFDFDSLLVHLTASNHRVDHEVLDDNNNDAED